MLKDSSKFIIDFLCKRENTYLNNISEDEKLQEELLDEIHNHKLTLLINKKIENKLSQKNKYKSTRLVTGLRLFKTKQFDFFKMITEFLNSLKIDYILLKGFVNEVLAYNNITSRIFSDFDLLVKKEDYDKVVEALLNSNLNIVKYEKKYDYYLHEEKIIINYKNLEFLIEIKDRHREMDYNETRELFSNIDMLEYNGAKVKILNFNNLIISNCLYIYNYMERLASCLYLEKIRIGIFYDLYNLIINNENKINVNLIEKNCISDDIKNKVLLVIRYLYEIFSDNTIYNLYMNLDKKINNKICVNRFPTNFGVVDRIFNYLDIRSVILNYFYKDFYICDSNYSHNNVEPLKKYVCFKKYNVDYSFEYKKNELIFYFYNLENIELENYVLYIMLYYVDIYGNTKLPYDVISLRFNKGNIYAYNAPTILKYANLYEYHREKGEQLSFIIENNYLKIPINFKEFCIRNFTEDKIGWNIEISTIDSNGKVYVDDRNNDDINYPSIFKMSNYE